MGTADFAAVLAQVEAEYAAQAARRVAGSDVMWALRDGTVLRHSADVPMGMPASAAGRQVSQAHARVPALGCQSCGERRQVLVPCAHPGDVPDRDCPRCAATGKTCAACHGTGTIAITETTVRGEQVPSRIECAHPDGTEGDDCLTCGGDGKVCAACAGTDQRPVPCPGCQPCGFTDEQGSVCGLRACPHHLLREFTRLPEPAPAASSTIWR